MERKPNRGLLNIRWMLAAGLVLAAGASIFAEPPDEHEPAAAPAAIKRPAVKSEKTTDEAPASTSPTRTRAAAPVTSDESTSPTPEAALAMLKEGNERWISGTPTNPNTGILRRKTLAENGQKPFATVLTCADSRLPVERIFDRGVGDVFVLRVAGNVVGTNEAGTIEYGTEHLHTPILVVMGHTKCGAVTAVVKGDKVGGNIATLVAPIGPAVQRARKMNSSAAENELILSAIRENVWQSMFDLFKASPDVCQLVREKKVLVVGAICDVSTGKIEWLGEHPWQDALIEAIAAKKGDEKTFAENTAKGSEKSDKLGEKNEKGEKPLAATTTREKKDKVASADNEEK